MGEQSVGKMHNEAVAYLHEMFPGLRKEDFSDSDRLDAVLGSLQEYLLRRGPGSPAEISAAAVSSQGAKRFFLETLAPAHEGGGPQTPVQPDVDVLVEKEIAALKDLVARSDQHTSQLSSFFEDFFWGYENLEAEGFVSFANQLFASTSWSNQSDATVAFATVDVLNHSCSLWTSEEGETYFSSAGHTAPPSPLGFLFKKKSKLKQVLVADAVGAGIGLITGGGPIGGVLTGAVSSIAAKLFT